MPKTLSAMQPRAVMKHRFLQCSKHPALVKFSRCLSNCVSGDEDDGDELLPLKLKETKRLQHRAILQLDIGGQHVAMLAADADSNGDMQ